MGATAAAVVTTATVAPLAIKAAGVKAALTGDAILLALVQSFHGVYGEQQDVWAKLTAHRAAVSCAADCGRLSICYTYLSSKCLKDSRFPLPGLKKTPTRRVEAAFSGAFFQHKL